MAKQSPSALRGRFPLLTLLPALILGWIVGQAGAGEDKMITDIAAWHHPVKDVLKKFRVHVYKVELRNNATYPIFYVRFPFDPQLGHNNTYFKPLYYETLKANGFWDYAFIAAEDNCRINITWNKKTKTLTEDLVALDAPGEQEPVPGGATGGPSPPKGATTLPPPPPMPD